MSHRKETLVRKIVKNGGGSLYINIPKEIAETLHLRERQKIVVKRSGQRIILEDWR